MTLVAQGPPTTVDWEIGYLEVLQNLLLTYRRLDDYSRFQALKKVNPKSSLRFPCALSVILRLLFGLFYHMHCAAGPRYS